jgi:hypothetical protein
LRDQISDSFALTSSERSDNSGREYLWLVETTIRDQDNNENHGSNSDARTTVPTHKIPQNDEGSNYDTRTSYITHTRPATIGKAATNRKIGTPKSISHGKHIDIPQDRL